MVSGKLVHLIESHWDEIISRIVVEVRRDTHLARVRAVIEPEMRE